MEMAVTPEGLRRTRAALADIPARLDRLQVNQTPLQPVTTNVRDGSPALPASYLSPAPSPDEIVIQQRGRRRLPVNWSPDVDLRRNSSFHSVIRTPPKESSPSKLGVTLRSTPRKRLLLGDSERIPLTPEKIDFSDISTPQKFKLTSPIKIIPTKRARMELKLDAEFAGPIETGLKALSPVQLINMIKGLVTKHPELEQEVRKELPMPDLGPLEEKLSYLKSNIYRSLPTSRLTSKTDSPAFSRVATHLTTFKKCVVDQGKLLVESQHWDSVVKYVFMAWSYVRATPLWDNQPHNAQRKQCFKALISFCMAALKKRRFDRSYLLSVHDKLQEMVTDSEDIHTCLKFVQSQLQDCY